jgi:hypothetical protein
MWGRWPVLETVLRSFGWNSIIIIFLPLLHQNYRGKTGIPFAELTNKNWPWTWTIPCVLMGARSKSISPEKRCWEPPSSLFLRSTTVPLLVLQLCQRATKRPTNHGREWLGRQVHRHLGARSRRRSSIILPRMDGVGHEAWGRLLSRSAPTKEKSYRQISGEAGGS